MPAKTQLDIHLTAATAAAKLVTSPNPPTAPYDVAKDALEAFDLAGLDKPDFEFFNQEFRNRVNAYANLAKTPSASALAAKQAAAKAAAPAPAPTAAAS